MPPAGRSNSLWAPLASSSTPFPNADTPAEILEASSVPSSGPTPNKTPGLSDHDDNRDASSPATDSPPPTVHSEKIREKKGDFYRQYSAYWQFGDSEYRGDCSSRISWGDTGGFSHNTGRGEDESNDPEQGEIFEENLCRMASWAGQPDIKGRNETIRMMLLCAVHFGITFTWGVEMTCEALPSDPSPDSPFGWHADGLLRASQIVRHIC